MDVTVSTWIWVAGLGGAGGALSAWLAGHSRSRRLAGSRLGPRRLTDLLGLGQVAAPAAIAATTAAATAWMIGSTTAPALWEGRAFPSAIAFFWIGFVTAGWLAAERDKRVLRDAVCSAATAPAAHPDTVQALAHASPDAVYEAVKALVPRRVVH